jgi:RNA polymerase sigma-70 factor (ECF subfamily)
MREERTGVNSAAGTAREKLEELVLRWQGPLYNLAHRILGNAEDAADATQEAFARILRGIHRLDARRDPAPWIYRVATNVVLNHRRDAHTRRQHERRAAENTERDLDRDPIEDGELGDILRAELTKLAPGDRALVVLHYYQGLSQTEIAQAVRLPRTTVQSRLQRALEAMRRGLAASGSLALVPRIESGMLSATPLAVPPQLSSALLSMAVEAEGMAAAGIVTGGLIMSKQVVAGSALVAVALIAAGYLGGWTSAARQAAAVRSEMVPQAQYRALQDRVEALAAEIEGLKAESRRPASVPRGGASPAPAAEEAPAAATAAGDVPGVGAPAAGIDWAAFARKVASGSDVIIRAAAGEELPPLERTRLAEVHLAFMKVSRQARMLSEHPFFDAEILPPLVNALLDGTLDLSTEQEQALAGSVRSLVEASNARFDLASALPVEVWRERQDLIARLGQSAAEILDEAQAARWKNVEPFVRGDLCGDHCRMRVAVDETARTEGEILRGWRSAFLVEETQVPAATALAERFAGEAREILRRFDRLRENAPPPSPEETARMEEAFFEAQRRAEGELMRLLGEAQAEKARRRYPTIFSFQYGGGMSTSTEESGGI